MRAWEPRKRLSDLPTNRAMIRIVRHDQTERLAPHKICEYLACSPGMNVLVVECSGGNSRPSCPSGVGGGTLGNRKISSSVAGQSQTGAGIVRTRLRPARKFLSRGNGATQKCAIEVGHVDLAQRARSSRRPDHGSEVPICRLTMLASRRSMLPLASISARKLFSSVVWP